MSSDLSREYRDYTDRIEVAILSADLKAEAAARVEAVAKADFSDPRADHRPGGMG